MKDTARQIGRLFTIEKPTMIYDEEAKKEIPTYNAENCIEIYPNNFDEHKHELLKYRIEKRNAYKPSERILSKTHIIKQELKTVKKYISDCDKNPKEIDNWLRYYEDKEYDLLLESYRDYLLEQLKETKGKKHESGSADNEFSVLQWATIFYYANQVKLLSEAGTIKEAIIQFMKVHKVSTSFANFKNKYYDAKKRLDYSNEKHIYPKEKLQSIIPFVTKKYKQAVTIIEKDIEIIEEENLDY